MPTTVISVRGRDRKVLQADPNFVYVGRANARLGWKASPWGNPFRIARDIPGQETAPLVVAKFRMHLLGSIEYRVIEPYWPNIAARFDWMARELATLRGKTLGCYCGEWNPGEPDIFCHAVTLAKLAEVAPC